MDQYTRREDVVINRLDVKHLTYARAAAGGKSGEDAPAEELERQVINFFESKKKKKKNHPAQ